MKDEDIKRINERIKEILMPEEPKELYEAMRHLILSGGKRIRPIVSMHSAGAVKPPARDLGLDVGVAIELIHNFTLIHDDIMDKSQMRRHVKTTHVIFGEPIAIDAGDALFARAFLMLYDLPHTRRLLGEVAQTSYDLCRGQAMDVLGSTKLEQESLGGYLKMIELKTARLFQASARCGGIVADATNEELDALGNFGLNLGMAFQIQDDVLDVTDNKKTGKALGGDIVEGKTTILVVHALENADENDKQIIRKGLGRKGSVQDVIGAFKRSGSIDFAKNLAEEYAQNARRALGRLKDSEDKNILIEVLDYMMKRES